jgi:membrane associated rhomboid family serine protease
MDRSTNGLRFDGSAALPPGFDPRAQTPLDRATAIAALVQADDLLEQNEPEYALPLYSRATATEARDVAAAGYYGLGNVLYRMDREAEARAAWEQATSVGENAPVAYRAWRQVAAARVRDGDLRGAVEAYRRCERLAPREDRAEIASRLGWLSKETGNAGAAQKYFARSRGDVMPPFMTYLIIAVTVVTSLMATSNPSLLDRLELMPMMVARGEYFRILTVALVHDPSNYLHLIFNMYALWYAGQLVERMYGSARLLFFYVLCAAAGSAATYAFGMPIFAHGVGASGAIFGLFGIVLVATRLHHAVLDAQSRAIASQVGILIVLNLFIGLSGIMRVDNFAHVGGLLGGLWLALILPPTHVQTLSSVWQRPQGESSPGRLAAIRFAGVIAMIVVVGAVIAYGTINTQKSPIYKYYSADSGEVVSPAKAVEDAIHVAPVEARSIGRPDDGVALQG